MSHDGRVRFIIDDDAERFAAEVRPFLEQRIEHNLPASVLQGVIDGRSGQGRPVLVRGLDEHSGRMAAVAVRTPPWSLVATSLTPADAAELIELWLTHDPELPGVNGPVRTARSLAHAWEQRTGGTSRIHIALALHCLTTVADPPRPADGSLHPADLAELDLLTDWATRFATETGTRIGDAAESVRARLRRDNLWLWRAADGVAVSMVGASDPVAGVPRIAPVYTPPDRRRRGYAGTAVAAVSHALLHRGARACALFTDVTNPTSNKIYAAVGYRRIGDWEDRDLSRVNQ